MIRSDSQAENKGMTPAAIPFAVPRLRNPKLRLVKPTLRTHPALQGRDPSLIRRVFPILSTICDRYYRAEVEGVEHLSDRAALMVGTHNGGMATPDSYALMVAFWRRFGLETPAHGLMHGVGFKLPYFGQLLPKLGAIHATPQNAQRVLQADRPCLVYPGGDLDSLKPFRRRHQITFGNRRGFIKTAIREQVPIIPIVSVGAHETLFVLNDGRKLAELTGFSKLFRIKTMPITFSFPFGLGIGGLFALPLPSKIKVKVLPRIELAEAPSAANDPAVVEKCFEHVTSTMQTALTGLASARRHVILG
jgi:1-acyl-sn-glycerol-3-phosphate acyltransferase